MHTYAKFVIKCKAVIGPSAPSNMKQQQQWIKEQKRGGILNIEVKWFYSNLKKNIIPNIREKNTLKTNKENICPNLSLQRRRKSTTVTIHWGGRRLQQI